MRSLVRVSLPLPRRNHLHITRSIHIDIKRNLIFEDNHLFVVNKPSGLLVQAPNDHAVSTNTTSPNLLDEVKQYLQSTQNKPRAWLGLVHRLDRPTSGVIVFAKTSKAASRLSSIFRTRYCRKIYLCVVNGQLSGSGHCSNWLSKGESAAQLVRVVDNEPTTSSSSSSSYEGYKYVKGLLSYQSLVSFSPPTTATAASNREAAAYVVHTLCRIELETGRKHQIRAQMAHLGHPIVGDVKYGASQSFKQRDIALHAHTLTIAHPVSGEEMTFTAPPPALWSKRFGEDIISTYSLTD